MEECHTTNSVALDETPTSFVACSAYATDKYAREKNAKQQREMGVINSPD